MYRLAYVYPGQGSQYIGMAKAAMTQSSTVKEFVAAASDIVGFDLLSIILEGPEEDLRRTSIQQPAILTVNLALTLLLTEAGLTPSIVAGHSLGEYCALAVAGCISYLDAVRLVHERGKLMESATETVQGGMAAILGLAADEVSHICDEASDEGTVEVANYNCPNQTVISGVLAALTRAVALAKTAGAKRAVVLPVSGPFHSSLMAPIAVDLRTHIDSIGLKEPAIPFVMNFTADFAYKPEYIAELLTNQLSGTVKWEQSVRKMAGTNVDAFVEVGPGKVLSGLIKRILVSDEVLIYSVEDVNGVSALADAINAVSYI